VVADAVDLRGGRGHLRGDELADQAGDVAVRRDDLGGGGEAGGGEPPDLGGGDQLVPVEPFVEVVGEVVVVVEIVRHGHLV
jgi:hypothetical protein